MVRPVTTGGSVNFSTADFARSAMFRKLRAALRFAWIYLLWLSGALRFVRRRLRARGSVVVLTLHRVLSDVEFHGSSSLPGILVRQPTFDQFLAWASRNCDIIDLEHGAPDWDSAPSRPRIALTFDDGWLDNYEIAQPIAARHGASMTVFICPGLMDRRFPFWPERVSHMIRAQPNGTVGLAETIERLKLLHPDEREKYIELLERTAGDSVEKVDAEPTNQTMTWDEIRELRELGVRFGSHTVNHTILTQVPINTVSLELRESRIEIEKNLTGSCDLFAYPNGNWNPEVRKAVSDAGFRLAFTTRPGVWSPTSDSLLIPRVNLSENHLVGPNRNFSSAVFEYVAFWRGGR
jgi:peptidoglycan/xylan/chitin deacetylase (PgdA/CDA1 family)